MLLRWAMGCFIIGCVIKNLLKLLLDLALFHSKRLNTPIYTSKTVFTLEQNISVSVIAHVMLSTGTKYVQGDSICRAADKAPQWVRRGETHRCLITSARRKASLSAPTKRPHWFVVASTQSLVHPYFHRAWWTTLSPGECESWLNIFTCGSALFPSKKKKKKEKVSSQQTGG